MSKITEVKISFTAEVMTVSRAIETQRPDALCFEPCPQTCHSAAQKWQLLTISVQ
jgi:O-methyltransferase involved in polyketide biosynthesis